MSFEEQREQQKERELNCPAHVWHETSDRYVDTAPFGFSFLSDGLATIDTMCAQCGKKTKAVVDGAMKVTSLPPLREGFHVVGADLPKTDETA